MIKFNVNLDANTLELFCKKMGVEHEVLHEGIEAYLKNLISDEMRLEDLLCEILNNEWVN